MPIYEYECSAGHRFEELQKISQPPVTKCKECGKPVRKLVSPTAFSLKGSGWYQDGYSSKPVKAESKESKSSQKKQDNVKGETKPTNQKGDKA